MRCPRCNGYAWQERDPELGVDIVCIAGHRVSPPPLPEPVPTNKRKTTWEATK